MALRISLSRVLLRLGFQWHSRQLGLQRHGLLLLSNLAGPIQHFRAVGSGGLEE